jgi:cytosine/adenosine deaminase-related metal-dependent hydrolase
MSNPSSGTRYERLVIRNATVINGRGTPPFGPVDILIEKDTITEIAAVDPISLNRAPPEWKRPEGDHEIDATGKYVIPGIVNMHTHISFDDKCGPRGPEYAYKLSLAHGVTTIRTCGFGTDEKLVEHRRQSNANEITAPRLVVLGSWPSDVTTVEGAREAVHKLHDLGVDGIKIIPRPHVDKEMLEAMAEEARKLGFPAGIAIHIPQYSELDALDASEAGGDMIMIEHTYGIPQAAIPGSQTLPADYNYADELDRFRWSGKIWTEADQYPEKVREVLETLVRNGTAWDPTMVVYEANRDLQRARTFPWHEKYTVPHVWKQFEPSPGHHASYHFDWTTADEVAWKRKYVIWMKWLKEFFEMGGTIVLGEDTAFIYEIFGFAAIREMELHQEAGIHPIDVIKIATTNGARRCGLKGLEHGIRQRSKADIAIVDGNPLHNFKVMYGTGVNRHTEDGRVVKGGGVVWTIKDGVVFDAKKLLAEVAEYVAEAKEALGSE